MTGTATATILALVAVPAARAAPFEISTPYPAVRVEPGNSVTFAIEVTGAPQRVNLEVARSPRGWTATLRGGGFVIDGVYADRREPPEIELEVSVPEEAQPGTHRVVVVATSSDERRTLPLELTVGEGAAGSASLVSEFPLLRGPSDATFTFDLDLENDTAREVSFSLEAQGPPGWNVEARPSGEQQAATARVEAGGSAGIQVEADPPDDTVAGSYPIVVQAMGGGQRAEAELAVEITGNFALTVTTPDERLNADVLSGRTSEVELVLRNDGTAPVRELELSATPPADWRVDFAPRRIDVLAPGQSQPVTARVTPSGEAVAGDYVVTVRASSPDVEEQVDIRATVKTSTLWGGVGIALIVAALVGLGWLFRRYGRR